MRWFSKSWDTQLYKADSVPTLFYPIFSSSPQILMTMQSKYNTRKKQTAWLSLGIYTREREKEGKKKKSSVFFLSNELRNSQLDLRARWAATHFIWAWWGRIIHNISFHSFLIYFILEYSWLTSCISFSYTAKWSSYKYTYTHSFSDSLPI